MNILVTGACGQLGNEMRIVSSSDARNRYYFTDVLEGENCSSLDITDAEAIREYVNEHGIDAIVNCAAYTNVEAAEDNQALAEKLNATAPGYLAAAMKELGGILIHISTDYVFGTEPYNTPCAEDQKGTPTGIYGLTKLHGEQAIMSSGCDYFIIRTAWLYSEFGKNFVKTMLTLTSSKPELKVVFDQTGTPTYALDLALAIKSILSDPRFREKTGVYHYSDEGVCSWYDFTQAIYAEGKRTGIIPQEAVCHILPCHSNEFPSKVTRPAYSVLDKSKIKNSFGLEIPYWTESLNRCIENIWKSSKQK